MNVINLIKFFVYLIAIELVNWLILIIFTI